MNPEEMKKAYYSRPKMKHYVLVLLAVFVLIGAYYLISGSGQILSGAASEQPPALPGTSDSPAVENTPSSPPADIPPLLPLGP